MWVPSGWTMSSEASFTGCLSERRDVCINLLYQKELRMLSTKQKGRFWVTTDGSWNSIRSFEVLTLIQALWNNQMRYSPFFFFCCLNSETSHPCCSWKCRRLLHEIREGKTFSRRGRVWRFTCTSGCPAKFRHYIWNEPVWSLLTLAGTWLDH